MADTRGYPGAAAQAGICVRDARHVNDKTVFKANVLVRAETNRPHAAEQALRAISGDASISAHTWYEEHGPVLALLGNVCDEVESGFDNLRRDEQRQCEGPGRSLMVFNDFGGWALYLSSIGSLEHR